jgi:hypothetical protein
MSAYICFIGIKGGITSLAIVTALIFPLIVGLWFLKELARKVVSTILILLTILLPIGIINPFAAMDMQPSPPGVWELAFQVYPWVAVGLLIVHVLGKYKSEFKPLFKSST